MSGAQPIDGVALQPGFAPLLDDILVTDQNGNGLDGTPFEGLSFEGARRWSSGVQFSGQCGKAHVWPRDISCDPVSDVIPGAGPGTNRSYDANSVPAEVLAAGLCKEDPCVEATEEFFPGTIYYSEGCRDEIPTGFDLEGNAEAGLSRYEASRIMHELATGFGTGNPSLWSSASYIDQAASGPLGSKALIRALAAQVETEGGPGGLFMHVPSWVTGNFTDTNQIHGSFDADGRPQSLWTPQGWRVNPGPGLTGTAADPAVADSTGIVSPNGWSPNLVDPYVYLTSGLWLALGPVNVYSADDRKNLVDVSQDPETSCTGFGGDFAVAERQFIIFFNPCLVWGAQMDADN